MSKRKAARPPDRPSFRPVAGYYDKGKHADARLPCACGLPFASDEARRAHWAFMRFRGTFTVGGHGEPPAKILLPDDTSKMDRVEFWQGTRAPTPAMLAKMPPRVIPPESAFEPVTRGRPNPGKHNYTPLWDDAPRPPELCRDGGTESAPRKPRPSWLSPVGRSTDIFTNEKRGVCMRPLPRRSAPAPEID